MFSDIRPERYWKLSKREQADAIWQVLFVENTPISEATRGIITVLKAFDLPAESADLEGARSFFRAQRIESHSQRVLQIAGVSTVVMTNDPLDPQEQSVWMNGLKPHPQFESVLRLDRILCDWQRHWQQLVKQGYDVDAQASGKTPGEIRRFLSDWQQRHAPGIHGGLAPDTFQFPEETIQSKLLAEARDPFMPRIGSSLVSDDWCPPAGESETSFSGRCCWKG